MSRLSALAVVLLIATAGVVLTVGLTAAAASASPTNCPHALDPGPNPVPAISRAIPELVRAYYRDLDTKSYRVTGMTSLDDSTLAGQEVRSLGRIATKICGASTTRRMWLVFLQFPYGPDVNHAQSAAFIARSQTGWILWRRYFNG